MPCRTDNDRLLKRLSAFVPKKSLLKAFMRLTFAPNDEVLNKFLQERFSEAEILEYWVGELSDCIPGTLGAARFYSEYFGMSDNLKLLAQVSASKFTAEEFANELVTCRVFEENKNSLNPTAALSASSKKDVPETIETVLGKIFGMMSGLSNNAGGVYLGILI